MEKYRVVLTCWDFDNPKPYADNFSGVEFKGVPVVEHTKDSRER